MIHLKKQSEGVETAQVDKNINASYLSPHNCLKPIEFDSRFLLVFHFSINSSKVKCPSCTTNLCKYSEKDFSISFDRALQMVHFTKFAVSGKNLFFNWDDNSFSLIWEKEDIGIFASNFIHEEEIIYSNNDSTDYFSKAIPGRYYTLDLTNHYLKSSPQINRY